MASATTTGSARPSTDDYPVTLDIPYPEGGLNRFLIFVKWLLIIPHLIVLAFLSFSMLFAVFLAWWAILFTGRYPRALYDVVVGFQQWNLRTAAYSTLLLTDQYPPFSFGRPLSGGAVAVIVVGAVLAAGGAVLYFLLILATLASLADPAAFPGPIVTPGVR